MDGLNINPALNVYFGVGPLGIFLPLFWIIAVGYWSYGAIIGALSETPKIRYNESVEWIESPGGTPSNLEKIEQIKESLGDNPAALLELPTDYATYHILNGDKERALVEIAKIEALPETWKYRAGTLAGLYAALGDLDTRG